MFWEKRNSSLTKNVKSVNESDLFFTCLSEIHLDHADRTADDENEEVGDAEVEEENVGR